MEEILREIFAQDRNILLRREELIAVLDKKVPSHLRRDYAAIRKALELNVGALFILVENIDTAKKKATIALKKSGMQEARIDFVVNTFSNALQGEAIDAAKLEEDLEVIVDYELKKNGGLKRQPVDLTEQQIYTPSNFAQDAPSDNKITKLKIFIGFVIILAVVYFFI